MKNSPKSNVKLDTLITTSSSEVGTPLSLALDLELEGRFLLLKGKIQMQFPRSLSHHEESKDVKEAREYNCKKTNIKITWADHKVDSVALCCPFERNLPLSAIEYSRLPPYPFSLQGATRKTLLLNEERRFRRRRRFFQSRIINRPSIILSF